MIDEIIKKVIYTGIGIAAVTAEKTGGIIESLEQKGEEAVKEGKIINEELKRKLAAVESNIKEVMDSLEKMSKEEIESIKEKLEKVLDQAENKTKMDTEEVLASLDNMGKEEIESVKAKIVELTKKWTDDQGTAQS